MDPVYHELGAPVVQSDLRYLSLPLYLYKLEIFVPNLGCSDAWECSAV